MYLELLRAKLQISSSAVVSVVEQAGLNLILSETPKTSFTNVAAQNQRILSYLKEDNIYYGLNWTIYTESHY